MYSTWWVRLSRCSKANSCSTNTGRKAVAWVVVPVVPGGFPMVRQAVHAGSACRCTYANATNEEIRIIKRHRAKSCAEA